MAAVGQARKTSSPLEDDLAIWSSSQVSLVIHNNRSCPGGLDRLILLNLLAIENRKDILTNNTTLRYMTSRSYFAKSIYDLCQAQVRSQKLTAKDLGWSFLRTTHHIVCRGGNTYIDSGKVLSLRMTFREPNTKGVFYTMETGVLNIQKKLTFVWGSIAP